MGARPRRRALRRARARRRADARRGPRDARRAPRRARLRRRRRRPAPAAPQPPPAPVATARATLIAARPFDDEARPSAGSRASTPRPRSPARVAVLNRMLHLHRTATADPSVREVARGQALVARVGHRRGRAGRRGALDARARGPGRPRPPRRSAALRPDERLAALLAGRDAALACEELTVRARADLDAGRHREAALQLGIALEAALRELAPWAPRADLHARLDELRDVAARRRGRRGRRARGRPRRRRRRGRRARARAARGGAAGAQRSRRRLSRLSPRPGPAPAAARCRA